MAEFTYLSFGAGVQSTALLAMCVLGERGFPRPDVVIHARTQSELTDTDRHVEFMRTWCNERNVPFLTPTGGSLERAQLGLEAVRENGYRVSIPAFTEGEGMLKRQCTSTYKIDVIHQALREFMGYAKGERVAGKEQVRALIGISYDELDRMRTSQVSWITNVYPLVDERMGRWDCEDAIKRLGIPLPPKSSCVFCPFHDDRHWSWMKAERPADFARAVAVDEAIRDSTSAGVNRKVYLHARRLPLAAIDFDAILAEDRAQGRLFPDQFRNECQGICGV